MGKAMEESEECDDQHIDFAAKAYFTGNQNAKHRARQQDDALDTRNI